MRFRIVVPTRTKGLSCERTAPATEVPSLRRALRTVLVERHQTSIVSSMEAR